MKDRAVVSCDVPPGLFVFVFIKSLKGWQKVVLWQTMSKPYLSSFSPCRRSLQPGWSACTHRQPLAARTHLAPVCKAGGVLWDKCLRCSLHLYGATSVGSGSFLCSCWGVLYTVPLGIQLGWSPSHPHWWLGEHTFVGGCPSPSLWFWDHLPNKPCTQVLALGLFCALNVKTRGNDRGIVLIWESRGQEGSSRSN